jgi:predicted dehydrogenase
VRSARRDGVGVGIVGCGRISGLRHLPALASTRGIHAVALADVDESRLNELADRFHIERRFAHHKELITDPAVDVVAVCVPPGDHVPIALDALAAGRHVFLEKPISLTLADADRLAEASAAQDRHVMLGFNVRWHRLVLEARDLLRVGVIGEVDVVRALWTSSFDYRDQARDWRRARETGGGALAEIAPHHVDLLRFLLDDEVGQVFSVARSGPWDDEAVVVTGRMVGGALFTNVCSQRSANRNELDVVGAEGTLSLAL